MALVFNDTFTGADGPLIGHVPDVPGTVSYVLAYGVGNPEALFLQTNRGRFSGTYGRYDTLSGDVAGVESAREYRVNLTLNQTAPGAALDFLCRMGASIFDCIGFGIKRPTSGATLEMYALIGNGTTLYRQGVGTLQAADGTNLQIGMSQVGTSPTFRFWYRIAGGVRIYLSNYTFASALEDASHRRIGFGGGLLSGFPTASFTIQFDSLEADTVIPGAKLANVVTVPVTNLSVAGQRNLPNAGARWRKSRPQPFNAQNVESGGVLPNRPTLTVVAQATLADLVGSAFSSPRAGAKHLLSRWQVDEKDGGFVTPVYDSGWVARLTRERVALSPATEYVARVAYADDLLEASPWSLEVNFQTLGQDTASAWQTCGADPTTVWEQCSA